jgi:hypothetical protein
LLVGDRVRAPGGTCKVGAEPSKHLELLDDRPLWVEREVEDACRQEKRLQPSDDVAVADRAVTTRWIWLVLS